MDVLAQRLSVSAASHLWEVLRSPSEQDKGQRGPHRKVKSQSEAVSRVSDSDRMKHEGQSQSPRHAHTHVQSPTPALYSPCSCKTGTCVIGWSFFCASLWLAAWRWANGGGMGMRNETNTKKNTRMGFNVIHSTHAKIKPKMTWSHKQVGIMNLNNLDATFRKKCFKVHFKFWRFNCECNRGNTSQNNERCEISSLHKLQKKIMGVSGKK